MATKQKVVICQDLQTELQAFLAGVDYDKLFLLADTNTKEKCYPLIQDIPLVKEATLITVEATDLHKNLESLASIWAHLSNEGATRHSLLLNLGGGMVTDMGGFAGATFKRGIRTANVPTTLMASVDAAVGGKTGINFNGLKNEIGAFYPPLCVFIDCGFLRTLDRDNILSGYAEMIKHGLISSMEVYAPVMLYDIDTMNYSYLNQLVAQSVAVKGGAGPERAGRPQGVELRAHRRSCLREPFVPEGHPAAAWSCGGGRHRQRVVSLSSCLWVPDGEAQPGGLLHQGILRAVCVRLQGV